MTRLGTDFEPDAPEEPEYSALITAGPAPIL
jgi:hypothetical protein